jgi:hypothetical protein
MTSSSAPTWQQLGLQVTGPDGAAVPVRSDRSTARYDVDPRRLGQAVATFDATTAEPYRVSAASATRTALRLALGDNFARTIAVTSLGAASLGLLTLLAAGLVAVVTSRARTIA